jgi:hypothetical protein
MKYRCHLCKNILYIVDDLEESKEGYIDVKECGVCSQGWYFYFDNEFDIHWCKECHKNFIFCCDQPCIIKSVCNLGKDGWFTFENDKFILHDTEYPFDVSDETGFMDISSLELIDHDDKVLLDNGVWPMGPDGGIAMEYQCQHCDEKYQITNK